MLNLQARKPEMPDYFFGLLEDLKSCINDRVKTKEVAMPIIATVKNTIPSKFLKSFAQTSESSAKKEEFSSVEYIAKNKVNSIVATTPVVTPALNPSP